MHSNPRSHGLAFLVMLVLAACTRAPSAPLAQAAEIEPGPELQRAIGLVGEGDAHAGFSALETWLDSRPDAPAQVRAEAHRWAAHACAILKMPEEGLRHADAGLALTPDDPWLHYARGVALNEMGELPRALGAFSRALELDPMHVKSARWRGDTHSQLGQYAEAVIDFDRALAIIATPHEDPALEEEILHARSKVLDVLGQHDAAEADRTAARALFGR